ncbi:MAG TPA: glycosyltransferase [Polyangiaceae bacterium]|jgi:glycosyltransferase involved in cell wall biosynthesis
MSTLSIAHVLSSFDMGGQERVALELATLQRAAGHRVLAVSIAASSEGANANAFRAAGVSVQTVAKGPRFDPSLPLRLAHRFARQGVDVVHTHNPHALIYGAPAARLVRAVAVHTKHGMNPDTARRMWLRRAATRFVQAYVAVTAELGRVALEKRECAPERLCVISNGIDAARFAPNPLARQRTRRELGIPENAWVVGTVGRLSPEKDQKLLIDAMTPLLDSERQLLIVGDGPERESLSLRVAATWKAHFVHMTGARKDPENLLAACDAFALTSRSEGLPLVILEAMAMRLPIVSTAVGGVPDVVAPGVTGILVAAGDRAELTRQLDWLASHASEALAMADVARQAVLDRYTIQHMANDYEALYARLVAAATGERAYARLEGARG